MPSYAAFAFRQNDESPITLVFVAPSCEIDEWAKVPTRLSNQPHNFQRAAIPLHVAEIKRFFSEDQSKRNSSPTSILLGVEPSAVGKVALTAADGSELKEALVSKIPIECFVNIDFEPWDSSNYSDDLDGEITALFEKVEPLYATAEANAKAEADTEDESVETSDAIGDDADEADDNDIEDTNGQYLDPETSAERFLASIDSGEIHRICVTEAFRSWTPSQKQVLRDLFIDDLKPCLIIDGQHRVRGTRNLESIPFSVSMLPRADWAELAFQFIVNNSSAKKVDENLLFGIVGQSLTQEQLGATEVRLSRAGIKVSLIKAAMRVQIEPNPFTGMIKMNTPGERGFIDAMALQKKVIELWYGSRGRTGLKPAFKAFCAINGRRKKWSMQELFSACANGGNAAERARDWQEARWFLYFKAFWEAVSQHFSPRLWPATQGEWLPNDVLISSMSPEQKERQKLMRATVLGLLQKALLQAWADHKNKELRLAGKSFADLRVSPDEFRAEISGFVRQIPMDFFTELKFTGFDASGDLRDEMTGHFLSVIEMNKSFAELKAERFWRNT